MDNDNLFGLASELASLYPPGVLPGLHPIELLTGARYGFDAFQARHVLQQPELLDRVRKHWDKTAPTQRFKDLAAADNPLGHLNLEILRETGHLVQIPEMDDLALAAWLRPEPVSAGATADKGGPAASATRWRVHDRYTAANVTIVARSDGFEFTLVPRANFGTARMQIYWDPTDFTQHEIELRKAAVSTLRVVAPSDDAKVRAINIDAGEA